MNHPDLDRLTAWVHELLDRQDAEALGAHIRACAECREMEERVREEACTLAVELAPDERLRDLKASLLRQAEASLRPVAPRRGVLWQAPLAAAVLLGLVAILAWPGPRHVLTLGRVAFEDGREMTAPADLAGLKSWRIRALVKSSVLLADRSTVELAEGSWMGIEPRGERGVQANLTSGEAVVVVAPDRRPLTVTAPAGRVECHDGIFRMRLVVDEEGEKPMKGLVAGALVTVLAGSASLANDRGTASLPAGGVAALASREAPLVLGSPQDAETLLKRLEQLAARVAKLEDEIGRLETKNTQLKAQLKSDGAGGFWVGAPGDSVRMKMAPGGQIPGPGAPVIIELEEKAQRLNTDPKSNPRKEP